MTRTWCYFPTQTSKIGGTDISHGATPQVSTRFPRVPMQHLLQSPRQGTWGRHAAEAGEGDEEMAGGALHPTLVTSCSEPRQTQQRLLVPPGPAPGLSLKVLTTQGHTVTALPKPLSSLQPSHPAPAWFLPEAGCPLPFRAPSRLCLSCSHHRW